MQTEAVAELMIRHAIQRFIRYTVVHASPELNEPTCTQRTSCYGSKQAHLLAITPKLEMLSGHIT